MLKGRRSIRKCGGGKVGGVGRDKAFVLNVSKWQKTSHASTAMLALTHNEMPSAWRVSAFWVCLSSGCLSSGIFILRF